MATLFNSSTVVFVPDSQLIFPNIFFKNETKINRNCAVYKTCFELMRKYCNYLILPTNELDFVTLINGKFRNFLKDVNDEIIRARNNEFSKRIFYRNTWNRLNDFNKDYGDLLTYWNQERETFWTFVALDPFLALQKQRKIALNKIQLFSNEVCRNNKIAFSEAEEKLSDEYYVTIKKSLQSGKIDASANPNDADKKILADCLVFNEKRLANGIMYLVTGDKKLEKITKEIVNKPHIIYPHVGKGKKLVGFRPLDPKKFIKDTKNHFEIV